MGVYTFDSGVIIPFYFCEAVCEPLPQNKQMR